MNWLQFIATVIGHLAWPIVFVVLLIVVRKQIGSLTDRLLELSFGGAKLTFEKKLQQGAVILEHVLPEKKPTSSPDDLSLHSDDAIVSRRGDIHWLHAHAVDQIISRYERVDGTLFSIADKLGFDPAEARSVMYTLLEHKVVSKEIVDLYQTIKDARNIVVHAGVLPSQDQAHEYARQAIKLLDVLMDVENKVNAGEIKIEPRTRRG